MATQKPISSISYNTEAFLLEKLNSWVSSHLIQTYQYILHKGEDGDKDHIHFRIEPNKQLDPMDLTEELKEYPFNQSKPLGIRPWRPSKEEDWFLYAVHDKSYLDLKYDGGEKGEKLPYDWRDIKAPDNYDVEIAFIRAKAYLAHTSANIGTRLRNGENPLNLVLQGENPYLVNAIVHTVSHSDYQRIVNENNLLRRSLNELNNAVNDYGLNVHTDDDGNIYLSSN